MRYVISTVAEMLLMLITMVMACQKSDRLTFDIGLVFVMIISGSILLCKIIEWMCSVVRVHSAISKKAKIGLTLLTFVAYFIIFSLGFQMVEYIALLPANGWTILLMGASALVWHIMLNFLFGSFKMPEVPSRFAEEASESYEEEEYL